MIKIMCKYKFLAPKHLVIAAKHMIVISQTTQSQIYFKNKSKV